MDAEDYRLNQIQVFKEKKPQIKAPRVAPLEGASTSTVAPVDVAQPSRRLTPCTRMPAHWHTWTRPQGAQPLTYGSPPYVDIAGRYAPAGAYVSMHCGGHDADEHRLNAISEKIIAAAFEVSNVIGVGFLEKVYENALNVELKLRGMETLPQAPLKVHYKDNLVGDYIADMFADKFL